jgi:hypothetical protein
VGERRARLLATLAGVGIPGALIATGAAAASSGQSILQEVSPLVWVMVGLSAGGAIITYFFLFYAAWKFRDPRTRRRNYG